MQQSVSRQFPTLRAASRMASISAWAVGSVSSSRRLRARATTSPPRTITQPTGVSPAKSASRACKSASRIHLSSMAAPPLFHYSALDLFAQD